MGSIFSHSSSGTRQMVGIMGFPSGGRSGIGASYRRGVPKIVPDHEGFEIVYKRLVSALGPEASSPDAPLFRNDRGGRITESSVRRRLYRYVRESRLRKEDLTPHDLRRTFATWYLSENPEGLRDLAELLGHSDLTQVMKYALSDEKRARAGVRKIGEADGRDR